MELDVENIVGIEKLDKGVYNIIYTSGEIQKTPLSRSEFASLNQKLRHHLERLEKETGELLALKSFSQTRDSELKNDEPATHAEATIEYNFGMSALEVESASPHFGLSWQTQDKIPELVSQFHASFAKAEDVLNFNPVQFMNVARVGENVDVNSDRIQRNELFLMKIPIEALNAYQKYLKDLQFKIAEDNESDFLKRGGMKSVFHGVTPDGKRVSGQGITVSR